MKFCDVFKPSGLTFGAIHVGHGWIAEIEAAAYQMLIVISNAVPMDRLLVQRVTTIRFGTRQRRLKP